MKWRSIQTTLCSKQNVTNVTEASCVPFLITSHSLLSHDNQYFDLSLSFSLSIQYCIFKNILWVLFLNFVYKNAICFIFQLASFTQHFISESHPWSRLWGHSICCHCYEAFHWMNVAQCVFIHSLSMNIEVFSVFWDCKQCWFEDLVFVPWGTGIKDSLEWVP